MKLRLSLPLAAILVLLLVAPSAAQSAFSARGLGFPLDPIDARARGLGGVALGFPEPEISWVNPASAIGLAEPGLIIGYQYDNFDTEGIGATADGRTARFPLIMAAFPASERLVFMAGYGSFLDQNWRVERPDSLYLSQDTVPITDVTSSEGGVARLRLGAAYEVIPSVGIGLAAEAYTGDVERVEGRLFEQQQVPACCRGTWSYSGIGYTAGLRVTAMEALSLAGAVTYGGTLDAEVTAGDGATTSYDLPIFLRGGATGRVGQATLLAIGGTWSGWSSLDESLGSGGAARDAWSVEGGIEYEGVTVANRPVPLRIGGRTAALPFLWDVDTSEAWVDERVLTFGTGIILAGGATQSDVAVEWGSRGGPESGLDESFWRVALSVRVLGR